MSYQPDPPAGAQPPSPFGVPSAPPPPPPTVPQYAYAAAQVAPISASTPAPAQRRKGLMWTGIAIAVLGIGAGVALIALSGAAKEETIKKFARAPVGCTTTLEFDKSATFTLYIETKGTIASVDGDCEAGGTSYERGDDDLPRVSLTLLNSADEESALSPAAQVDTSYAAGDFAGQAYQTVDITEPGTYRLTVTSDDTDFAIAIGGDPEADAEAMTLAGGGAFLVGLLVGGLLIVLGLRKKKTPPSAPTGAQTPWQPTPAGVPGWQPQTTVPGAYPTAAPAPYQPAPSPPVTPTAPPVPGPTGPGWGAPQQ